MTRCVRWRVLTGLVVVASRGFGADTLVVDLNGTGQYSDIQAAIDAAADGDTVLVKPGEYVITEPIDFNRLHQPDDPESPPVKNVALRAQDGPVLSTIRMSETPSDPKRASVVIFQSGETDASVLEGFAVIGGGETCLFCGAGGGVYCSSSSPTLRRCTISGNGGGVFCTASSPALVNCAIRGNGSGVDCWSSSPTLENCTLWGNGGGLFCADSSPTLTHCTIAWNSERGVDCLGSSSPKLDKCRILGNKGSGVYGAGDSLTITDCAISENGDGGVFCRGSATIVSCTISENRARGLSCQGSPTISQCTISWNGIGVYTESGSAALTNCEIVWSLSVGVSCGENSSPRFTNCTIAGNSPRTSDGGLECWSATPVLSNCILWDNRGGSIRQDPSSNAGVRYCLIQGDPVWPGNGNINSDPLFVDPGHWDDNGTPDDTGDDRWVFDFHLLPGSPAIDAGSSEGAPITDIEGDGRPCGAAVDIGAYEFGDCAAPANRFRRGDADDNGTHDISDPIEILGYLFLGEEAPSCLDAADADDDGALTITDPVYTLSFLFLGGQAPPEPFPACGFDLTQDLLDCRGYTLCP